MIGSRASDDLAVLVYTSGTTGPPKGAMHANRSVVHQMRHANDLIPASDNEERLVFLPLCHVAERVGGYYISLALGSVMNFAESPETVPDNLREVQPTVFLAVPRIWEKFYSVVTIALKDATRLPELDVQARARDRQPHDRLQAGGHGRRRCRCGSPTALAYWLVFRNIRRMIGLDRCRIAFTGRGADRAGSDPLVSRARPRPARGLRPDRELRRRDADAVRRHQARLGRQVRALGRGRSCRRRAKS